MSVHYSTIKTLVVLTQRLKVDVVGGPPANDWAFAQAFGLVWVTVQVPSFWNDSLT